MNLENPTSKIEKVNEFVVPESEIFIDNEFIKDLNERLHCRFDGEEFKKIIESLEHKKITLPSNMYTVYDKLENFNNRKVMDVLFEQGIEEMETQDKEKILRNIKFFVENNSNNKILLTNNQYSHLGFYKNENDQLYDLLCQRHNDSNEWLFWLSKTAASTNSTHRAIVEKIKSKL